MFKILDGRTSFYQWDIDRKLVIEDESIKEVHFCNKTDDCSLVCEVYSIDGVHLVNVPNILLQDNWRINVYAYDGNYTKHSECFNVISRSKPADYVYTETEIKSLSELEKRVEKLEQIEAGFNNVMSGNVIRANNALEAPLSNLVWYGKTTQDGTPTLENPIALESVGSDSKPVYMVIRGKNLIKQDSFTLTKGGTAEKTVYANGLAFGIASNTYTFSCKVEKSNLTTGRVAIQVYTRKVYADAATQTQVVQYAQAAGGDGTISFTFKANEPLHRLYFYLPQATNGDTATISNIQIELGAKATDYEAYLEPKYLQVSPYNSLNGIPVLAGGNYTDTNKQQWICDTVDFHSGKHTQRCGVIESYNGEEITGAYLSTTGELSTGASVVYALAEPIESKLTTAMLNKYNALVLYAPTSTIYTNYISDISFEYEIDIDMAEETVTVDTRFEPTKYSLPILYLKGETKGMTKENAVELEWTYKNLTGICSVKWQGSSSIYLDKKNYTIKFDTPFEVVEGWGEQKKYCFKANYVDASHARNVCSAKLWGQCVKSRSVVPAEMANLPNGGAIDGFPCMIVLNDEFHGLYTWNIPKDGWMFGMGEETRGAILCADDSKSNATGFWGEATALDEEFSLEYATDENDTDWILTSLNTLINACVNSDGTDLDTTIAQYLDWDSAMDLYIFTVLTSGADNIKRNHLLVTFDGVKWYFSNYDMDETFGQYGSGTKIKSVFLPTFESGATLHRVFELIKTYKAEQLKARYKELREGVMSELNVYQTFGNFIGLIPTPVYIADVEKWTTIPQSSVSNFGQISYYYGLLSKNADKWIEEI